MTILDGIAAESFALSVGPEVPTPLLRRRLRATVEVASVAQALRGELVTDEGVGDFVQKLLKDFSVGKPFVHDLALAALAVALEERGSRFASEFIETMAGLRLQEMPTACRVARECMQRRRSRLAADRHGQIVLATPQGAASIRIHTGSCDRVDRVLHAPPLESAFTSQSP